MVFVKDAWSSSSRLGGLRTRSSADGSISVSVLEVLGLVKVGMGRLLQRDSGRICRGHTFQPSLTLML